MKARHLLDLAERRLGHPPELSALDVGCGIGLTDGYLGDFGRVEGVDVSEDLIERAAAANPAVRYRSYDGRRLPYGDGSFDLVFAICVVHHVPPAEWQTFVAELARVVRPGGLTVVFEHNPLNPLTRLAVSRCAFDKDVALLPRTRTEHLLSSAGLAVDEARYILFFPWRSRRLRAFERRIGLLPLGAQYYAAARKTAPVGSPE